MGSSTSKPSSENTHLWGNPLPDQEDEAFHTRKDNLPHRVVRDQVSQPPDPHIASNLAEGHPHQYQSFERDQNCCGTLILHAEIKGRKPNEIPVNTNGFQYDRRNSKKAYKDKYENPTEKQRKEIWTAEQQANKRLNIPGPHRSILRHDPGGNNILVGMIYHPPGDFHGFERAVMQPMDREDRRLVARHSDRLSRSGSWPERGLDSDIYRIIEQRHNLQPDKTAISTPFHQG